MGWCWCAWLGVTASVPPWHHLAPWQCFEKAPPYYHKSSKNKAPTNQLILNLILIRTWLHIAELLSELQWEKSCMWQHQWAYPVWVHAYFFITDEYTMDNLLSKTYIFLKNERIFFPQIHCFHTATVESIVENTSHRHLNKIKFIWLPHLIFT